MNAATHAEHQCLLRAYGRVQTRCSALMAAQAAQIDALQAERMRLRMALMVAVTAAAWLPRDERLPALLALAQAQALLCRTTCIPHGLPARRAEACTRTAQPCVLGADAAVGALARAPADTPRDAPAIKT